ncbi:hypothetical protein [Bizionia arctica]|uniref:Lipoprotein n=1 Tax=Bizionia arctica TaxID=1495645 RepID=A0A917GIT7_9FLAO|nr:hypothetical protein [Bizionia arctica]GGG47117.1 hypothetical protein GCM10010976_18190 [Bizionia arctica]
MTIIRVLIFSISFLLILSCKKKPEDNTFKIVHLAPDEIIINKDTLETYGWYSKTRNDFFVVKNFDQKKEQHKITIDSFIVRYIEKDSFLHKNKNVNWSLTFFNYGDGIDENTVHEYNTDYTMHTLFAPEKVICEYGFNNRFGYNGSYYVLDSNPRKLDKTKSDILIEYFKNKGF